MAYISITKFLPFINSTIRIKNTIGRGRYLNEVNTSGVRSNTNSYWNQSLYIRTGFKKRINFETGIGIYSNRVQSDTANKLIKTNTSIKVLYDLSKKITINFEAEVYIPNSNIPSINFTFFNFELKADMNKKLNLLITGRNITSTKSYTSNEISDYNNRREFISLENSYIMASVEFSFLKL